LKPTNVKISITLVTGGGLKTDTGASAPVLPPPSFSTRQVFILTTLNKLLFMVKTLSWNQTMGSFAISLLQNGKAAAFAYGECKPSFLA
jgi:hypothetical protein